MNPNEDKRNARDDDLRRHMRVQARRALFSRRHQLPFEAIIDQILEGKNSDDGAVEHLPTDWRVKLNLRLKDANLHGDRILVRHLKVIENTLAVMVGVGEEEGTRLSRRTAFEIIKSCKTQKLSCWVAGTLGVAAASDGDLPLAVELTRHAIEQANSSGLLREECDWTANLGSLIHQNDSTAGEKYLRKALEVAKSIPCEKRVGRLLNNLAFLFAKLQRRREAVEMQREALRIARQMEDDYVQANRAVFMAQLLAANGERDSSILHFSEAVKVFFQIGDMKTSKQIVEHLIETVIEPLESETASVLGERVKKSELTVESIRAMLEQAKNDGKIRTYSSESKVAFRPDTSFAHSLCDRQEWKALAVYAKHWAQQTELSGDGQGYHWLAVALRKLGYHSFAEVCIEWGLRIPLAFD